MDDYLFGENFVPDRLVGRESQIKEILDCICPLDYGGSTQNVFIFGPPGVGKTVVCKWILKQNFPDRSAYVNCWSRRTAHAVMQEILRQLGRLRTHRESTTEFIKRLEESGKKIIVCLDECDQLREKRILYDLARNGCGLVLISNGTCILSEIDARIRSSLFLKEVEFKPYTKKEINSIIRERMLMGLPNDGISDELLRAVSEICNGDARAGLQILRAAAKLAESRDLPGMTIEEIKNVTASVRKYRLSYILSKLNQHQRAIYEILKKHSPIESGKLYGEYCKAVKSPVVDRAYRKYMARIEELGLVRSLGSRRWKKYEVIL